MGTRTTETEQLLELEAKYWDAMKNRDGLLAAELSADPCVVSGPQGFGSFTPRQIATMMLDARYELRDFHIDNGAEVQLFGDDLAIVAYKVHEDLIVEGKPVQLDAAESSTWVKRNGKWRCALHTEAILGDPFGRDRAQVAQV